MERDTVDYSLYHVTGRLQLPDGMDPLVSLEQACAGGVTIVQIREKNISTRTFLEIGRKAKEITDKYRIPLLINDRLDIALALGCGLHVGQSDMPAKLVRELLGDKAIIGVSVNTPAELQTVLDEGIADYVGVGPVHFTSSKDVLSPILGPRGIRDVLVVLGKSHVKAVAIGGISETTIDNLMRQSAAALPDGSYRQLDGVAIISAIAASSTPKLASANLLASYKAGLARYAPSTSLGPLAHSDILAAACSLLKALRDQSTSTPLIHHITNTVVQNDTANLTLALGGSPIMSASASEAEELGQLVAALLINFGTINPGQSAAMLKAGQAANRNRRPVIFDPVGVGATTFRKQGANELLNEVHMAIIKGNAGEIGALSGSEEVKARGVDSVGDGFKNPIKVVKDLALREKLTVAMSGKIDYISDGEISVMIKNGHFYQGEITGSGCMASTAVATFASVSSGPRGAFLATVAGLLAINVAAEIAAERPDVKGPNTFRAALIDECYNLTPEALLARASFELIL